MSIQSINIFSNIKYVAVETNNEDSNEMFFSRNAKLKILFASNILKNAERTDIRERIKRAERESCLLRISGSKLNSNGDKMIEFELRILAERRWLRN